MDNSLVDLPVPSAVNRAQSRVAALKLQLSHIPEEYRSLLLTELEQLSADLGELSIEPDSPPRNGANYFKQVPGSASLEKPLLDGVLQGYLARPAAEGFESAVPDPDGIAQEGIWEWDLASGKVQRDEAFARLFGSRPEDEGMDWWMVHIHPDDLERVRGCYQNVAAGDSLYWTCEYRFERADGSYADVFDRAVIWRDAQGRVIRMKGALLDLTALKQVKQVQAQVQMQRFLMQHREIERQRIARDLHDGPIQDMIGMVFQLQLLSEYTPQMEAQPILEQLRSSLKGLVDDLRQMTNELRPPALTRFGLKKAIQLHAEEFRSRYSLPRLRLDLADDGETLAEDVRLNLYRIYQECLENVLRHTDASEVFVRLTVESGSVCLSIQDDGQGFCPPADWLDLARSSKFGLVSMKERAEAVGGRLLVKSVPEQGTLVTVWLDSGSLSRRT